MLIAEYYVASHTEKQRQTVGKPIAGKLILSSLHEGLKLTDDTVYVTGKRQARVVAEANGYKPWNF